MDTTTKRQQLFADTVARPLGGGSWALMNRQAGGFSSSALTFESLGAITERFAVRVGEWDRDEHGPFVRIIRVVQS